MEAEAVSVVAGALGVPAAAVLAVGACVWLVAKFVLSHVRECDDRWRRVYEHLDRLSRDVSYLRGREDSSS